MLTLLILHEHFFALYFEVLFQHPKHLASYSIGRDSAPQGHSDVNYYCYYYLIPPPEVKISGLKTRSNNKLELLRVGVFLNWESLVKED